MYYCLLFVCVGRGNTHKCTKVCMIYVTYGSCHYTCNNDISPNKFVTAFSHKPIYLGHSTFVKKKTTKNDNKKRGNGSDVIIYRNKP